MSCSRFTLRVTEQHFGSKLSARLTKGCSAVKAEIDGMSATEKVSMQAGSDMPFGGNFLHVYLKRASVCRDD